MANHPLDFPEREERLGEIVFAWLQAAENGQVLDKQEVLARHPEFASELQEFFADQKQVKRLVAPLREVAQALVAGATQAHTPVLDMSSPGASSSRVVGHSSSDYELLEELGAGGNGVVYR